MPEVKKDVEIEITKLVIRVHSDKRALLVATGKDGNEYTFKYTGIDGYSDPLSIHEL